MADKKRDIIEFFEQSNFEQFTPTLSYDQKFTINKKKKNNESQTS